MPDPPAGHTRFDADPVTEPVRSRRLRSGSAGLWLVSGLISLIFAAATMARLWLSDGPADRLLDHLDLRRENNLAVWWSGTLLLLISALAAGRFGMFVHDQQRRALGWLAIALVALMLSADEVGSLHERVALLGVRLGIGAWPALAPFGLILIGLTGYALAAVRSGESRRRFGALLLGISVLLTVPLQEYLGDRLDLGRTVEPIRGSIEEAVELIGMLLLLAAALPLPSPSVGAVCRLVAGLIVRHALSTAGAVSVALLPTAAATAATFGDGRGQPSSWLTLTLCLGAALTAGASGQAPGLVAAAGFVLASLVVTEIGPLVVLGVGPLDVNLRLVALALALVSAIPLTAREMRAGCAGLAALAVVLASQPIDPLIHFLIAPLLALAGVMVAAGGFDFNDLEQFPMR